MLDKIISEVLKEINAGVCDANESIREADVNFILPDEVQFTVKFEEDVEVNFSVGINFE